MLWIHLITWVLLLIVVLIDLFGSSQRPIVWQMIARVLYLVAIGSGIFLLIETFKYNPSMSIIKIIVALGSIALIEIAFAKQNKKQLTTGLVWDAIIGLVVVGVLGLWLAQGRPFI
ncbi:DUF1516 family protein [Lentilactobacillus sp. Marseille-Q4993]|uniref:DUF1516 family protein n=1 Tax=Lentilactobacillus sp. Marseille-Q4993 TaxID=3039492 RepID=UPI0024BCFEAF|nr:DUF1516 family protein [Lentilactobacillus sp. Marseille-Q4993]